MNRFVSRSKTLNKRGLPIVISAASGTGKSTIIGKMMKRDPNLVFSVSATTREIRREEIDGVNYNFLSLEEFKKGIDEDRFVEWEIVHGKYYGTERVPLETLLESGKHAILDLDVNGGENLKSIYPEAVLIFIYPPSLEELTRRLKMRGTETEKSIIRRLARYPLEMAKGYRYPYHVINDEVDRATEEVLGIINSNGKF